MIIKRIATQTKEVEFLGITWQVPAWAKFLAVDIDKVFAYDIKPQPRMGGMGFISLGKQTLYVGSLTDDTHNNVMFSIDYEVEVVYDNAAAFHVLSSFEYSYDGFVKRYPEEDEYRKALAHIKLALDLS